MDDGDLVAGRGRKWGGERTWERQQVQARGAGCRDKRRKLADGGCGRRPGGRRSAPGEEVGSGRDREARQRQKATDGGGGRTEEGPRNIQKRLRQVGREGLYKIC